MCRFYFFFLLFFVFFSFPLTSYIYGRRIFLLNMQSLKKIKNKGEYGCDGTLGVRQERTLKRGLQNNAKVEHLLALVPEGLTLCLPSGLIVYFTRKIEIYMMA
ncbi:Uncharacterized protein APZ42_010879 [Daphnia magna]|uniref:Uncharacterized protein n=1 Tax=Daphnia magna TaxID=35525 RepID=A0A162T7X7_9CRUS|nr:Uncharacterized protein APZ42_010879 [Daphnia magna]